MIPSRSANTISLHTPFTKWFARSSRTSPVPILIKNITPHESFRHHFWGKPTTPSLAGLTILLKSHCLFLRWEFWILTDRSCSQDWLISVRLITHLGHTLSLFFPRWPPSLFLPWFSFFLFLFILSFFPFGRCCDRGLLLTQTRASNSDCVRGTEFSPLFLALHTYVRRVHALRRSQSSAVLRFAV